LKDQQRVFGAGIGGGIGSPFKDAKNSSPFKQQQMMDESEMVFIGGPEGGYKGRTSEAI
jgi:hypothetical protein